MGNDILLSKIDSFYTPTGQLQRQAITDFQIYNEGEYEKDILSIYNSKDTPILSFFVHVWSKIGL